MPHQTAAKRAPAITTGPQFKFQCLAKIVGTYQIIVASTPADAAFVIIAFREFFCYFIFHHVMLQAFILRHTPDYYRMLRS
jgi:hypothetical protein